MPFCWRSKTPVCDFLLAGIASPRQCRMSLVAIGASQIPESGPWWIKRVLSSGPPKRASESYEMYAVNIFLEREETVCSFPLAGNEPSHAAGWRLVPLHLNWALCQAAAPLICLQTLSALLSTPARAWLDRSCLHRKEVWYVTTSPRSSQPFTASHPLPGFS